MINDGSVSSLTRWSRGSGINNYAKILQRDAEHFENLPLRKKEDIIRTINEQNELVSLLKKREQNSFWDNAKEVLFGTSEYGSGDRFKHAFDVESGWNQFHSKRTLAELSNANTEFQRINEEISDLLYSEEYMNTLKEYNNIERKLTSGLIDPNSIKFDQLLDLRKSLIQQIVQMQEYIKQNKNSNVFSEIFFDPEKADFKTNMNILMQSIGPDMQLMKESKQYGLKGEDLLPGMWHAAKMMASSVGNTLQTVQRGIGRLLPESVEPSGRRTREVIRASLPEDRSFDSLFESYSPIDGTKTIDKLLSTINTFKDYYRELKKEKESEVLRLQNNAANGASEIWVPFAGYQKLGFKFWDPNNIDPEYKKILEGTTSGLFGWLDPSKITYSLPEVGSSWSDAEHFLGLMATDVAMKYAAQGLTKVALRKNPYVAALTSAGLINDIETARKVVKGAEALKSVENTANTVRAINTAIGATQTAASLYFTKMMRQLETGSEIADAQATRILEMCKDLGIDLDQVLEEGGEIYKDYLKARNLPYENYDKLDDIQKILTIVANNIHVSDENFNLLKYNARKGLAKLENENNTLALMDYWEALPFMDYTRSFLKTALTKNTGLRALEDNTIRTIAQQRATDISLNKTARVIDRIFKSPGSREAMYHTAQYLRNKASKYIPLMGKEAIEEGQQLLLQSRYSRGEYDDYSTPSSMFNLPSILEDFKLGTDAVAAYLGINFGDPDNGDAELRKAMSIGATTAMWFGVPGAVLSNVVEQDNPDNVKTYLRQLRTDRALNELLASNYQAAQDQNHIGTFFDVLTKTNVSKNSVERTLEDFKLFKGDLVDDEYIDRDIQQLNTTYSVYKNKFANSLRESIGIKKNSEAHKNFVQEGVKRIEDSRTARDINIESTQTLDALKLAMLDVVLSEDQDNTDQLNLKSVIEEKYNSYVKEVEAYNNSLAMRRKVMFDTIKNDAEKNKELQQIVRKYATRNVRDLRDVSTDQNYNDLVNDEIQRIYDSEDELALILQLEHDDLHLTTIDVVDKDEFAQRYINDMFSYLQLVTARKLQKELKDRGELLKIINRELGVDIDPNKILGVVDVLLDKVEQLSARHKKNGLSIDKNALPDLDNNDELIQAITSQLFSNALYELTKPLADAYLTGQADPKYIMRGIRGVKWSELSKAERDDFIEKTREEYAKSGKPFKGVKSAQAQYQIQYYQQLKYISDIVDNYVELSKRLLTQDELDRTIDDEEKLNNYRKKAAELLVKTNLADKENRKRIAHRLAVEDGDLTDDQIIGATRGDEEAQLAVDEKNQQLLEELQDKEIDDVELNETDDEADYFEGLAQFNASTESEDAARKKLNLPTQEEELRQFELGAQAAELQRASKNETPTEETDDVDLTKLNNASDNDLDGFVEEETGGNLVDDSDTGSADTNAIQRQEEPEPEPENENNERADKEEETDELESPITGSTTLDDLSEEPNESSDYDITVDEQLRKSEEEQQNQYDAIEDALKQSQDEDIDSDSISRNPDEKENASNVSSSKTAERNLLEKCFFYNPTANDPILLKVDDDYIKLPYDVHPGSELAQRLTERGWVEKCKKYYVVSGTKKSKHSKDFVVCLVILDDEQKACYLTFLRQPGHIISKGLDIKARLLSYGVNMDVFPEYLQLAKETAYLTSDPRNAKPLISSRIQAWRKKIDAWYESLPTEQKDQIYDNARMASALPGTSPLTLEQVNSNLNKLNAARVEIIRAYCGVDNEGNCVLPDEVRTDVEPSYFSVSNGVITTDYDKKGKPVYHDLTESGYSFEGDGIDQIDKKIKDGEVILGVGRKDSEDNGRYHVNDVRESNATTEYPGEASAGTIYLMAKSVSTSVKTPLTPIVLAEQRFKKQETNTGRQNVDTTNPTLMIDPTTGKINYLSNPDLKPSAAEVILYLMTGKLDSELLPSNVSVAKLMLDFAKMFVNYYDGSEETSSVMLSDKQERSKNLQHLAAKQIGFFRNGATGKMAFIIARKDPNTDQYRKQPYSLEEIFDPENDTARKEIVSLIAQNIHWNTDLKAMNGRMSDSYRNVVTSLLNFFNSNPEADKWSLCGLDQFTFSKNDLFENVDGELRIKDVSVLAWMIKNGKLLTTTLPLVFKDPFVFANGVKGETNSPVRNKKASSKKIPQDVPAVSIEEQPKQQEKQSRFKTETLEQFIQRFKLPAASKMFTVNGNESEESSRQSALSEFNSTAKGVEVNGNLGDRIALLIPQCKNVKELEQEIRNSVKKYIDWANNANQFGNIKFDEKNVSIDGILSQQQVLHLKQGTIIPVAYVYLGKGDVAPQIKVYLQPKSLIVNKQNYVTGVFSEHKASGKFNEQKARKYIASMLGLDAKNFIVLNGVMHSCENKPVFGLTQVALNSLASAYEGFITVSSLGGRGIEFHEAFHYVNLLLHDEQQRLALYKEYASKHPEFKTKTFKEIEEQLADEFMHYMVRKTDSSIVGLIRRFFDNIISLMKVFSKKDMIENIFKDIRNGKYAGRKMDKRSLEQFRKRHPNGVAASFSSAGTSLKDIDNLKGINDYHTFLMAGEGLAQLMLYNFSINRAEDIQYIMRGKLFNKVLDHLRSMIEIETDPIKQEILQDILDNPLAFRPIFDSVFRRFGIEVKLKRVSQLKQQEEVQQGEVPSDENKNRDDEEDIVSLEEGTLTSDEFDVDKVKVSKMNKTSFRAKLFLSTIPKLIRQFDESENKPVYLEVTNPVFGIPVFWEFGEAWNIALPNLHRVESWADRDAFGNLLPNSFVATVERLAKSHVFFEALRLKLDMLVDAEGNPDIQLQNQILATVRSLIPSITEIDILDRVKKMSKSLLDELGDDMMMFMPSDVIQQSWEKDMSIKDDNRFKALYRLPRLWSQAAFLNGMVEYTKDKLGNPISIVSKRYYDDLNSTLAEINKHTSLLRRKTKNVTLSDLEEASEALKILFIRLCNKLGIPFDEEVTENYISMHISDRLDLNDSETYVRARYNALVNILSTNSKNGGIGYIVNNVIRQAVGKTEFGSGQKAKTLDRLFDGVKNDSEIRKMAIAYSLTYPSAKDNSVTTPNGETIYPITQNNAISDELRRLNYSHGQRARELSKSPYAKHSILLQYIIQNFSSRNPNSDEAFGLDYLCGMKDVNKALGGDYFEITAMDDFVSKMFLLHENRIIFPTMADKKTWYAIKQSSLSLPHDLFTYRNLENEEGKTTSATTLSEETLNIFAGYFLDELNALELYYDRDNIAYYVKNSRKRIKNFHGKVVDGRMLFGGNGGLFRYFYDLNITVQGRQYNLNQLLQVDYNFLKELEKNPGKYGKRGVDFLRELRNQDLDGFELVRKRIQAIKNSYFKNEAPTQNLYNLINGMLGSVIKDELRTLAQPGVLQQLEVVNVGNSENPVYRYISKNIPRPILDYYITKMRENGYTEENSNPYSVNIDKEVLADATTSAIANYVLGEMISVIETEKIFTGDPAFYKYTQLNKKTITVKQKIGSREFEYETDVDVINEKTMDKIKRLGSALSTGSNIRVDYDSETLERYPELRSKFYTNAYINDINAISQDIKEINKRFLQLAVITYLQLNSSKQPQWFTEFKKLHKFGTDEQAYNALYLNEDKIYDELWKTIPKKQQNYINQLVSEQAGPYNEINVSDAQVLIRPTFYRKLRIGIGEWSMVEDESGYSDEKAYNILENDPEESWRNDPEKAAIVRKFLAYPLKMVYFANDPNVVKITSEKTAQFNLPILNKMAIFPWFKYTAHSTTGQLLYARMNKTGNELDMISFESAVKVGMTQLAYSPFEKGVTSLHLLNPELDSESDTFIDNDGNVQYREGEGLLAVRHLSIENLRFLMNTNAHEAVSRNLGTQALKLAFSNLIDDTKYGLGKQGLNKTGKQIRTEIMAAVDALTAKGVADIKDEFFANGNRISGKSIKNLLRRIVSSNDMGVLALDLIDNDCAAASLMQRDVFEYSVSSLVHQSVVDVNTKGGSAIQQSMFGFVGYKNNNVIDDSVLNNGRRLQYITKDGSMEILLGMNFFRQVLPQELLNNGTYTQQKQWLIDHDIIGGWKSEEYNVDGKRVRSNPTPFGIGYRIPTQGMSSMFSFVVADVLPEHSADLIVVPEEFTAQTGSDFDVDKLYLATLSYTNGKYDEVTNIDEITKAKTKKELAEAYGKNSADAIGNLLILNYILVLSDIKNFLLTRASIDTIGKKVKRVLLSRIDKLDENYTKGMSELTPSFQSNRKQEFSTGKKGISPFALSVTNVGLVQNAHISMEYGEDLDLFGLRALDEIYSEDGTYVSDWLSFAVSAHVDVSKDPFIFKLNVNNATWSMFEFLIRSGKALSAFTLMAQPILKQYANEINNQGGIYNTATVTRLNSGKDSKERIANLLLKNAISEARKAYKKLDESKLSAEKLDLYSNWLQSLSTNKNFDYRLAFNSEFALNCIDDPNSFEAKYYQVIALKTVKKLEKYADELHNLVQLSQIDTKKFGKTISENIHFEQKLNQFLHGEHNVEWKFTNKQQKTSKKPTTEQVLGYYFNCMWLMDKFVNSTSLVRKLLSHDLFTATPQYKQLFIATMREIFGAADYELTRFNESGEELKRVIHSYNAAYINEKMIKSIAHAIDSILRFKALSKLGKGLLTEEQIKVGNEEYVGPIDFAMGGDINAILYRLKCLMVGDPAAEDKRNARSIFLNVSNFIDYIKNNPNSDEAYGLIDEITGQVRNDLLKYLMPLTANTVSPLGRFLLRTSLVNTSATEKLRLQSAFGELLRHNSPNVRKLARDIAFYAYYSQYDTNTSNSFFDLVPREYRSQYDNALKQALRNTTKANQMYDIDDNTGNVRLNDILYDNENRQVEDLVDLICRNFYKDNKIVPTYYLHEQKAFDEDGQYTVQGDLNNFRGEIRLGLSRSKNNNKFYGAILTTYEDKAYMKILKGNDIFLYKKVGIVSKVVEDGEVKPTNYSVYICVPKLGIHTQNNEQYEFVDNGEFTSIFREQNMLPDTFKYVGEGGVAELIRNTVFNAKPKKDSNILQFVVTLNDVSIDPCMYYETQQSSKRLYAFETSDGSIKFIPASPSYLKGRSNLIVNLNNSENAGTNITSVDINAIDSVEKAVKRILKAYSAETSKAQPAAIMFDGNVDNIKVTKKEVQQYVDDQVSRYEARLYDESPEITAEELNNLSQEYRESIQQDAENELRLQKAAVFFNDLIYNLSLSGLNVRDINVQEGSIMSRAVLLASKQLKSTGHISNIYAAVDKKYKEAKNISELRNLIDSYEIDESVLLSSEEISALNNVKTALTEFTTEATVESVESRELSIKAADDIVELQGDDDFSFLNDSDDADSAIEGFNAEDSKNNNNCK